jgi:thiol-disulfide isomerase/thioredoxin
MPIRLLFLLLLPFCLNAQNAELIRFDSLQKEMEQKADTLFVVNFWATWCKPCVEELPGFLALEDSLQKQPVRFLYLSFDFLREKDRALRDFLQRRNIRSRVLLLNEAGNTAWMDKVDSTWQGAIPATWIYRASDRLHRFHEGELSQTELIQLLKPYLP